MRKINDKIENEEETRPLMFEIFGMIANLIKAMLICLILATGVALVFNQSIANYFVKAKSDEYYQKVPVTVLKKSEIKREETQSQRDQIQALYDPNNISALQTTDLIGKEFDNLSPNAKIIIPSIGMNLPIFEGLINENLMVGAGTMKPNQQLGSGNYALASHSVFSGYGSNYLLFSPLHRAKTSTTVYIIQNGRSYRYKITDIYEVTPDAGYVIDDVPGENLLTLVTCTDINATKRLIVQARFVEDVDISEVSDELKRFL